MPEILSREFWIMILQGDQLSMRYWTIHGLTTRELSQDCCLLQPWLVLHLRLTSDNSWCQVKEVVVLQLQISQALSKSELLELWPPELMMPGAGLIGSIDSNQPLKREESYRQERLRSGSRNGSTTLPSMDSGITFQMRLPVSFSMIQLK